VFRGSRHLRALLGLATVGAIGLLTAPGAIAAISPVSNTNGGAGLLADAIEAPPTDVVGAGFDENPGFLTPNGTANAPLSSFPTAGGTFSILTTGHVGFADDPNANVPDDPGALDDKSLDLNGGGPTDGQHARGNTDFDATVLRVNVDVPATANCLTFDFQFYSEEYQDFVNTAYNDGFIAELDSSTWTTNGSAIQAPGNFAFDPSGDVISVNSSGNTSMTAGNAAGTTYDGATPLLSASKQVTPGNHALYLSIFDQGDQVLDSAAFLDNLRVGFVPDPEVNCRPGAQPKLFGLTLNPATAENPVGTEHTVTATLTDENGQPVPNADVEFETTGANAASGSGATSAAGEATFAYTGQNAGNDVISACYDVNDDGICEATASATKRWRGYELALAPASKTGLAGDSHSLTATLVDDQGVPVNGAQVGFEVTGANSASGTGSTSAAGEATFNYTAANAGSDTISACYDANGDGTCDATATATATWKSYELELSPAQAENPVGTEHTVTATLVDEAGAAVGGATVSFDVSGANVTSGTASTAANGEAQFAYTGQNAGDDTIAACFDANGDGTCEATASASKRWVAANEPPDCSGIYADPNKLWPPDHKLRLVRLRGASDPDGDDVTVTITTVTQDEALNGAGDGNTSPDARRAPWSYKVYLRAERSGKGNGRVYEISFVAEDGQGGRCEGSTTVGVPHDCSRPAIDSGQTVNSFGSEGSDRRVARKRGAGGTNRTGGGCHGGGHGYGG
jgi:hypothetical protein